jgi:hypothetical protein
MNNISLDSPEELVRDGTVMIDELKQMTTDLIKCWLGRFCGYLGKISISSISLMSLGRGAVNIMEM